MIFVKSVNGHLEPEKGNRPGKSKFTKKKLGRLVEIVLMMQDGTVLLNPSPKFQYINKLLPLIISFSEFLFHCDSRGDLGMWSDPLR